MFLVASKPSSWLSSSNIVLCTSLSPPEPPSRRDEPMESISSMKMMEGACSLAMTNSSRTMRAPAGGMESGHNISLGDCVCVCWVMKVNHVECVSTWLLTAAHPLQWTSGPARSPTPWWRCSRCDEQQLEPAGFFLCRGVHTAAHPAHITEAFVSRSLWLPLQPRSRKVDGRKECCCVLHVLVCVRKFLLFPAGGAMMKQTCCLFYLITWQFSKFHIEYSVTKLFDSTKGYFGSKLRKIQQSLS